MRESFGREMARFNTSSLAFAIVTALVILSCGHWAQAQVCNGALQRLGSVCEEFVLKPGPRKDPSSQCCKVVQGADVPCVCANIPKGFENIISMEKVVYVCKFCGKPLESGTKCGNYTVPAA